MHGIDTIRQLNELAAQNAAGAPQAAIDRAERIRRERGDKPFTEQVDEFLAQREAAKLADQVPTTQANAMGVRYEDAAPYDRHMSSQRTELLASRSTAWLLDYVGGLENPTTLEVVLARKLRAVQQELDSTAKRLSVFVE
jgi:hypothetical protein